MKYLWTVGILLTFVFLGLQSFQQSFQPSKVSDPFVSDTLLARKLILQSDSLSAIQEFEGAIEVLKSAQEIYRKHALWPNYVDCFVEMAIVADHLDISIRDGYIDKAITSAKKHLPPDHLMLALAYRQRGESFINQRENDSSLYYLSMALPILENKQDWDNWTMCQMMVGINHYFLKNFELMDSAFIAVQLHLDEPTVDIMTRTNVVEWLGIQARLKGDYDAGIRYYQEVLQLNTAGQIQGSIDSISLFGQYYQLGQLHYYKGNYRRALEYFSLARNLYLALDQEDDNLSLAYFKIGSINTRLQNYPEAIRNLQQSLAVNRRIDSPYPEDIINANNVLGKCFIETERYDSAFYYLNKALEIPSTFGRTSTYGRMGICYKETGQIDKAIQYLTKAIQLSAKSTNGFSALWNMHLADCYSIKSDYAEALKYHQRGLMVSCPEFTDSLDYQKNPSLEQAKFPVFLLQGLHAKAETLSNNERDQEALETSFNTYRLAVELIDSLKADYVLESSQLTWGRTFKNIYAEALEVCSRLYDQDQKEKYLNQAFSIMEKSKSSLLLDALSAAEGKTLGGVPDSLIQAEKDLVVAIAYYEKKLTNAREEEDEAQVILYEGYRSEASLALADLKEHLQDQYPLYHQLKFERSEPGIEELQSFLPDDETAFVQYFLSGQHAMALVVSQTERKLVRLQRPDSLTELMTNFQALLTDLKLFKEKPADAFEQYNRASYHLYQQLLEPLQLQPYSKLILSPDGRLNAIPFEVLSNRLHDSTEEVDFGKLNYLIHQHQIQYAYSAGLLLKNQEQGNRLRGGLQCLAVAPPYQSEEPIAMRGDLEELRSGDIAKLQGTGLEIQAIAQYFPGEFDLSANATKAAFIEKAPDFNILHLAMHGEADFENSNFGNLIFTNLGTTDEADHRLYHYEITNMDLHAQLVVLSACETGLGKYEEGEGVFSLARSFMYAGAPSVVMSLWKVNDQSTSDLMAHFYENLSVGGDKSGALHEAKLAYLNETQLKFRHPYYWAGFVLLGDSRPLKQGAYPGNWLLWASGLATLIILIMAILRWRARREQGPTISSL